MSNKVEFNRLAAAVTSLLNSATVPAFQYDLRNLIDLSKVNLPKSRLRSTVSDILTLHSVIAEVGDWVVAEIEGNKVQFSRLSFNKSPVGNLEDTIISILSGRTESFTLNVINSPLEPFDKYFGISSHNAIAEALENRRVIKAVGSWDFCEDGNDESSNTLFFEPKAKASNLRLEKALIEVLTAKTKSFSLVIKGSPLEPFDTHPHDLDLDLVEEALKSKSVTSVVGLWSCDYEEDEEDEDGNAPMNLWFQRKKAKATALDIAARAANLENIEDIMIEILQGRTSSFRYTLKGSPLSPFERLSGNEGWELFEDALKSKRVIEAVGSWDMMEYEDDEEDLSPLEDIWFERKKAMKSAVPQQKAAIPNVKPTYQVYADAAKTELDEVLRLISLYQQGGLIQTQELVSRLKAEQVHINDYLTAAIQAIK